MLPSNDLAFIGNMMLPVTGLSGHMLFIQEETNESSDSLQCHVLLNVTSSTGITSSRGGARIEWASQVR